MRKKILIVDDERDLVHLFRLVLEMAGYDVRGTTSAIEALRLFEEEPADLVLLDVMMPDMNGIEVCRQLRALPEGASERAAIVMYTANDNGSNRQASRDAGATALLSKDIPIDSLVSRINGYFPQPLTAGD